MRVVATSVLAQSTTGVIFSALADNGVPIRVNVSRADGIGITVGRAYEIDGTNETYRDSRGQAYRQIRVSRIEPRKATGRLLLPWLEQLPHIGRVRAQRLLDAFGEGLLEVLADPEAWQRVAEVIDPRRPALALKIAAAVMIDTATHEGEEAVALTRARFLARLEGLGVDAPRTARQLWRLIGSLDAEQKLLANPYLAASLMPWRTVDALGRQLLAARDDGSDVQGHESRSLGALDSIWRSLLANGDTAISYANLRRQLAQRGVNADRTLDVARTAGVLVRDDQLYRAPGAAWLEEDLAERIHCLASEPSSTERYSGDEVHRFVRDAEEAANFRLTEEQRETVFALLARPIGVLQGGAGVGKTAVTAVVCGAWNRMGGNVVLTALSGKAALQLMRGASTRHEPRLAYTAARLLRMLEARQSMENLPDDWPSIDASTLLIVDEASMLDTPTLRRLIAHLVPGSQLLMVGDVGQLPPIGIGRCFHDLVEDGRWTAHLNTVLRQASDSPIPHAAAAIRRGETPELRSFAGQAQGIYLLESDGRDALASWLAAYRVLCDERPSSDVMAVAALTRSVEWLNGEAATLRRRRDGAPDAVRLGPYASVTTGDPVVCRQNRYSDGIVNGMLGVVERVVSEREVLITWDGEPEPRPLCDEGLADIGLAYAITCHKSQGSAAPSVIVLLESTRLLTREWLYTAITRARSLVVLVGSRQLLQRAIANRTERLTGFSLDRPRLNPAVSGPQNQG